MKKKKRSMWSALIALAIAGFAYIQFIGYIIPGFGEIFRRTIENTTVNHIGLIWIPVISYILVVSFICMVVRVFKELKPYEQDGLIANIIFCSKVGAIWGMIGVVAAALIAGLIWGSLMNGLMVVFIGGMIVSLTISLTIGFILGLIIGLIKEFK
jgi:hypothetical protein